MSFNALGREGYSGVTVYSLNPSATCMPRLVPRKQYMQTIWQPRGDDVNFTITSVKGGTLDPMKVAVCFR